MFWSALFTHLTTYLCGILETARDFVLWVWSTHNRVNERLTKDEASLGTGDPLFPRPRKRRVGPRQCLRALKELLWSAARFPLQRKECHREQGRNHLSHGRLDGSHQRCGCADWSCIGNSCRQLCIWCACLLPEDAAEEPQVMILLSMYSDLVISPTFFHVVSYLFMHIFFLSFQAEEKLELIS